MNILPYYPYIKQHGYNNQSEKKWGYDISEHLIEETFSNTITNHPKLPKQCKLILSSSTHEYYPRDIVRYIIRFYAFILEHNYHDPSEQMTRVLYRVMMGYLRGSSDFTLRRKLFSWSKSVTNTWMDDCYDESLYLMKLNTGAIRYY